MVVIVPRPSTAGVTAAPAAPPEAPVRVLGVVVTTWESLSAAAGVGGAGTAVRAGEGPAEPGEKKGDAGGDSATRSLKIHRQMIGQSSDTDTGT